MVLVTDDSSARRITLAGLPYNTYIVENTALEDLLFNRELVGLPFCDACLAASVRFLQHIEPYFAETATPRASELMILSKGRYYFLHEAFRLAFEENLECNYIATKREESASGMQVRKLYQSFLSRADHVIIGDTIATGVTGAECLSSLFQFHVPRRVFFVTYYGTWRGAAVINEVCERYGVELFVLFGLAAFGMAENGFDLPFIHPETITRDDYRQRAHAQFGGKPVSALGWDFGSQSQSVEEYRRLWQEEKTMWGLP